MSENLVKVEALVELHHNKNKVLVGGVITLPKKNADILVKSKSVKILKEGN